MHWAIWIIIGILGAIFLACLAFFIYARLFGKRVMKANKQILEMLDAGMMEDFRQNKPYEEIKDDYIRLIDKLELYSQYMHMIALKEEREFERQNECLILQYVEDEEGRKVARFHFRSFPIKTLMEKIRPKEMMIDAMKLTDQLLHSDTSIAYMEFVTHNQLLNESVLNKIITHNNLKIEFTYNGKYENKYMPWIFSEWLMIHGGDNPKTKEVYEKMRRMNQPIQIKVYRRGEAPRNEGPVQPVLKTTAVEETQSTQA